MRKNIPLEESVAGFAEMPEDLEALKELKDLLMEDEGAAPAEADAAAPGS